MPKLLTNEIKRKEVEEVLVNLNNNFISSHELAKIIGVSHPTILRYASGSKALDFDIAWPYSRINSLVIADRILGYIENE